jgi:hypothetical protein
MRVQLAEVLSVRAHVCVQVLLDAGVKVADAVVLGSGAAGGGGGELEADAQILAAVLQVPAHHACVCVCLCVVAMCQAGALAWLSCAADSPVGRSCLC